MAIWTIGIMLYEMVFGKKPFPNRKDVDHYVFVLSNIVILHIQLTLIPSQTTNYVKL